MKRCFGVIVLWMCIAISYIYWCSARNEKVVSSFVDLSDGYCIQEISVVSNKLFVLDFPEISRNHCNSHYHSYNDLGLACSAP